MNKQDVVVNNKNTNKCAPFLHLTVGLAGMIDESGDVAGSVGVDDEAGAKIESIVMPIFAIESRHSFGEPIRRHHFPNILEDEASSLNPTRRPHSPSAPVARFKLFHQLTALMSLDTPVGARFIARTITRRALDEHYSI